MSPIKILIDDENDYFAVGLRLIIEEYAQEYAKRVIFLTSDDEEHPDIVFVSSALRIQYWRALWRYGAASHIVAIKERKSGIHEDRSLVLLRTWGREALSALLTNLFANCHGVIRPLVSHPFTYRECQVISHLRRGMDQSQTAREIGVSVKTVHSHKRSVMKKLMLNRHREFMYWLISQDD
ncbi:helix-turn-helix transcriptional regulator [Serratia marcescens]|uniref:Helix-turn-helix transcriptional regulator n=1 Tax=Serratia marcescens TaxID=615 RepID=A0ABD5BFX9_SERMA|nr:helix-turn-helix transcriptional regulator [Serratia marcescens]AUU10935.1 LuxR family transcriptional regulator [Serratia marcescens]MBH2544499.1 helix-turn-helix transcriptional regulator [Serratia marcescens]MCZ6927394.1 LuxR family transcriptional regulator [Serratia marcescens]MDE5237709.1 helix-turn-helix transcriptional regulator [Serratia marcescens]MDE5260023.1 helix-turn-helix transcriptional regulator [Serratia marcescens]